MSIEQKHISFQIKSDEGDENTFSGHAAVFGNVDRVNDVIVAGAFSNTLKSGRKVKLLWNHDQNTVIGVVYELTEDETGLFIKARFADTPKAQEIRKLAQMGAVDAMSIGYRTVDYSYSDTGVRLLKEIALFEISLTAFPANELATIQSVKSENAENAENAEILTNLINITKQLSNCN